MSLSISKALMTNGMPSPAEYKRSMMVPANIWPCCEASMRADPRNAPTQGVQPTEKIIPSSADEKKPRFSVLAEKAVPRNMFILNTPRKHRPKNMTTRPEMMLTIV